MEKLKVAPINVGQKRLMVEYVQKYPNLAKQKFSQELSQILNSVPGGSKKTFYNGTWTDVKKNTKNKAVPKEKEVTDLEKDILEIIGNVMQYGHENIIETPVEFNFVDLDEHIGTDDIEIVESVASSDPSNIDIGLSPTAGTSAVRSVVLNDISTPSNKNIPDLDHSYSFETGKKLLGLNEKGKRLSVTRRLENSQKISAEVLKSMDCRTSMMEEYYKKKIDYFEHMKNYHEKKLQLQENNNRYVRKY